MSNIDLCGVPRCRRPRMLLYAAKRNGERTAQPIGVCEYHWSKHCDEEDPFDLRGPDPAVPAIPTLTVPGQDEQTPAKVERSEPDPNPTSDP